MFSKYMVDCIRMCSMFSSHGEVYPEIRAILFRSLDKGILHLRYYIDRSPIEKDEESLNGYSSDLISQLAIESEFDAIDSIKEDCIFSTEPMQKLGEFGVFLYARKEDVQGFKFY